MKSVGEEAIKDENMPLSHVKHPIVITEKTLLPISLFVLVIGVIFVAAQVYSLSHSNRKEIDSLSATRLQMDVRLFDRMQDLEKRLSQVSNETAQINGKLDIIIRNLDKKP